MIQDNCYHCAITSIFQLAGEQEEEGVSADILMARLSHTATPGYETFPGLLPPQGLPFCFLSLRSHLGAYVSLLPVAGLPSHWRNLAHWGSLGGPPHFAGGG